MLHANASDHHKVLDQTKAILTWHGVGRVKTDEGDVTDGTPHVYVRTREFYDSCRLSALPRRFFFEEVNDLMSGTEFVKKFGHWIFAEVGDGYSVFVHLGPGILGLPGVPALINLQEKAGIASLVKEYEFELADD